MPDPFYEPDDFPLTDITVTEVRCSHGWATYGLLWFLGGAVAVGVCALIERLSRGWRL